MISVSYFLLYSPAVSGQTHYCGLIRILIFKGFVYTVFSVLSSVATTPDALGLPHDPHLTI